MNIYKITSSRTYFVRADNEEQAKEKCFQDENYMFADEEINEIKLSSEHEMRQSFLFPDKYINNTA